MSKDKDADAMETDDRAAPIIDLPPSPGVQDAEEGSTDDEEDVEGEAAGEDEEDDEETASNEE